jgi:hypothetical protein
MKDYDWSSLPSPVVDIGGGIGSLELALVKSLPETSFQFLLFDIPETIENAKKVGFFHLPQIAPCNLKLSQKVWSAQALSAQISIEFQPGNFMAEKFEDTFLPAGKPIYLIRHVLHDWSDEQALHILKHVRIAMSASLAVDSKCRPKLVLCEMLLRDNSHRFIRTTSMQILSLNGGLTRTETEMVKLLDIAGFSVVKVHQMRAADTIIEAVI